MTIVVGTDPPAIAETTQAERHPEDDRIEVIRLDAPERSNVIDLRMLRELTDAVVAADRDDGVRGIVLGATGDAFCAGASLQEPADLEFEEGARWLTDDFGALDILRDTGKPVVAGVEGTCVAGGNELVSACDLIVAGESAECPLCDRDRRLLYRAGPG